MPSYITIFRATTSEQLSPLVALVESLLNRPIAAGITIRNVAAVPRTGHLYVYAEAPAASLISRLFKACGLVPVSMCAADTATWGRLIGLASTGNHWGAADAVLAPVGLIGGENGTEAPCARPALRHWRN